MGDHYERRWTDAECDGFAKGLDNIMLVHQDQLDRLNGDGGLEDLLLGIAELVARDRERQTHDGVIACLASVEEGLRHAAMDYYASWK